LVSLSCPTAFSFAFQMVYYWTNKDGWMDIEQNTDNQSSSAVFM